jgi:hypothetical protein
MYCLTPHQQLRAAVALMILLLGASCSETLYDDPQAQQAINVPLDEPPPDPATSPPLDKLVRPPPGPLVKPAPPPSVEEAPAQVAAIDPVPPPKALAGLSMSETESELGPPVAEADRAPAKVWQYRAGECSVEVYFYLDMARNGFYALHHEARRGTILDETCIRTIKEAGRVR